MWAWGYRALGQGSGWFPTTPQGSHSREWILEFGYRVGVLGSDLNKLLSTLIYCTCTPSITRQMYVNLAPNYSAGTAPVQSSLRVISVKSSALWHSRRFSIYNPEPKDYYYEVASSLDKDSTILVSGTVSDDPHPSDSDTFSQTLRN